MPILLNVAVDELFTVFVAEFPPSKYAVLKLFAANTAAPCCHCPVTYPAVVRAALNVFPRKSDAATGSPASTPRASKASVAPEFPLERLTNACTPFKLSG